ncbi:MAG: aminotransferase class V-fold PLP-dependent enzyme [Coriobacteriia bacterium]|nr:aminotransferase class V-fold PLP-dependent enzyme [Coriobacteriia bacterium]
METLQDRIICREDFPFLAQSKIAYLDNAATTQIPSTVLSAVEAYYRNGAANPGRGEYGLNLQVTQLYEQARERIAAFVGANAEEIAFTAGTTEGLNTIAQAYAAKMLGPGDEVLVTAAEHHSNFLIWQHACKQAGARLIISPFDANGRLDWDAFKASVSAKTKIVALAHVSNVLGTVFPIEDVVELSHEYGAKVVLDCAQSIGHLPLNLHALGVDFAAFSGHKMYALSGIGAMYIKQDLIADTSAFMLGGGMVDEVWESQSSYLDNIRKLEAGTPNVVGAISMAAAADYLDGIGLNSIHNHEKELTGYLLGCFSEIPDCKVHGIPGNANDRTGIVSFSVKGVHPTDVALALDEAGVCIRTGTHCAQPLHRRLGVEQSCRISLGLYNTFDDLQKAARTLSGIRESLGRRILGMFP